MEFSQLGMSEPFVRVTQKLGYETATPIQSAAIPIMISGVDLIGCAPTGTGKTAAFILPLLHRLHASSSKSPTDPQQPKKSGHGKKAVPRKVRALILSPTRELAAQIDESFRRYGRFTNLHSVAIYGGVKQGSQVKAVQRGVDALIATPGRLLDLMNQGHVNLRDLELLIFDEADQMLDMGFLPDLKRIVAQAPRERQTVMFSATMPEAIRKLTKRWLHQPQSIDLTPVESSPKQINQSVHYVDKGRKQDLLTHYLRSSKRSRTVVFSRTKHGADKIAKKLMKEGVDAAAIHGNKSQGARNRAIARFKSPRPPVLVATDIAARGLDIRDVSHVVNFDLPEAAETYVHRIGRTGRAGATGAAVSFCSAEEKRLLKQIERLTKETIPVEPTVEGFEPTEQHVAPGASPKRRSRPPRRAQASASGPQQTARRRRPKKKRKVRSQ